MTKALAYIRSDAAVAPVEADVLRPKGLGCRRRKKAVRRAGVAQLNLPEDPTLCS